MTAALAKKEPRKLSREARRGQLIEATIETLAAQGYARTTLTDVARTAGLSHGLVNFHFQTKENLLEETLQFLAEEYRENWTTALAAAGPHPAQQLDALIRADFNPHICETARLNAWCAFWGEAQCRPLYQDKCGANDARYNDMLEDLARRLITEGGYDHDPVLASRVVRVTMEGVWLDMMTSAMRYGPTEAIATVYACVAAFFPRHFSPKGLLTA